MKINDIDESKLIFSREYKKNYFEKEYSIISNNFYSQLTSIYPCQRKHEFQDNKYNLNIRDLLEGIEYLI